MQSCAGSPPPLERFAGARAMRNVLGEPLRRVCEFVKAVEYDEFLQVISAWEREHLLISV